MKMKESMDFYRDKGMLVTGRTGFRGAQLCKILTFVGAQVTGYSLEPPMDPSLFEIVRLESVMDSVTGDIRNLQGLRDVLERMRSEVVFHLVTQSIARGSYKDPVHTYKANTMGTVNVVECARLTDSARSFLNVTTDKVYENWEWEYGYREHDPLGGYNPYSDSKSCPELITHSYQKSFFGDGRCAVSISRAGNVIGGGDSANDRIIPDCIRAAATGKDIIVGNPHSTGPYQLVLEPLVTYLTTAVRQYEDGRYQGYYNVGPNDKDCVTTRCLVGMLCRLWGGDVRWVNQYDGGPHEINLLKLDCSRIESIFGWRPRYGVEEAVERVVEWSRTCLDGEDILEVMDRQIIEFFSQREEMSMVFEHKTEIEARQQILGMVAGYCDIYHNKKGPFREGDRIPYASRVYGRKEMVNLMDSSLEFQFTSGRYTNEFEKKLADYLDVRFCSLVNSGSSASLAAFMTLTSPLLGERRVKRGDEIITVTCGLPAAAAPTIQFGAAPVFVDVAIPQYNIDTEKLEEALSEETKTVMTAHTPGNPFDLRVVKAFCEKYGLWLAKGNCDALGIQYTMEEDGKEVTRLTGTIGNIGASSFYPSRHMVMGEGGAVYMDNPLFNEIIRSFRDWGRDCVCPSGRDNMCGHRFDRQFGELPLGCDHKYVYSHLGYSLKAAGMQAAIGCAQLDKFPSFTEQRRHNFDRLKAELERIEEQLVLPEARPHPRPGRFGFLITCGEGIERNKVTQYVEEKGIQIRILFAGNLTRHPCFDEMRVAGQGYRTVGSLDDTDRIVVNTFWVGMYPGMTDEMIDYMARTIKEAVECIQGPCGSRLGIVP